jgi:hypothetical protein
VPDTQINISDLAKSDQKYEVSVSNELPEDGAMRRQLEVADATQQRLRDSCVFFFALAAVTIIFLGCAYLFIKGGSDDKKWAGGILSAIASGAIGYLLGKRGA